jgi:hypothetical protein
MSHESLYFDCHSGLDPESSLSALDSRFRGNDDSEISVKKRCGHYTSREARRLGKELCIVVILKDNLT